MVDVARDVGRHIGGGQAAGADAGGTGIKDFASVSRADDGADTAIHAESARAFFITDFFRVGLESAGDDVGEVVDEWVNVCHFALAK